MKVENIHVYNIVPAIQGIRYSYDSLSKSDSSDDAVGAKDRELAKTLAKSGSSHRKFLRQISVSMDITAPLYWWKEMDQYKVATTTNSESTMHTITKRPIVLDDFEPQDFDNKAIRLSYDLALMNTVKQLNDFVEKFKATKNKEYWTAIISLLPESYLQKRLFTCNYETLRSIYEQRRNHKLPEWHMLCHAIEQLPEADILLAGLDNC